MKEQGSRDWRPEEGAGLKLVGSKIEAGSILDEQAISNISQEILKFQSGKKLKRKASASPDKKVKKVPSPKKEPHTPPIATPVWQLSSQTNKLLIDQQIGSILSLELRAEERKALLSKFFESHPSAALIY